MKSGVPDLGTNKGLNLTSLTKANVRSEADSRILPELWPESKKECRVNPYKIN